MKNPEFGPEKIKQKENADESGYSEKKQAKATESQFDLHQQKSKASVGTQQQIKLAAYHEVSVKLAELMNQYVEFIKEDLHRAQNLLGRIKELEKERSEIFKNITQ